MIYSETWIKLNMISSKFKSLVNRINFIWLKEQSLLTLVNQSKPHSWHFIIMSRWFELRYWVSSRNNVTILSILYLNFFVFSQGHWSAIDWRSTRTSCWPWWSATWWASSTTNPTFMESNNPMCGSGMEEQWVFYLIYN